MAPKLNSEYSKMLTAPAFPDGSRKSAIESLQKRIDFHIEETNRLRYAQNLHAAVSSLPAELLADVFLYTVESGLQDNDTRFATGTFGFLQVCKRWNEIAVGFPRLWGWWVAGAVKAWPLFSSRSKNTPLSLTWRSQYPTSARDVLMDPGIPKRIHRLNFSGTSEQLVYFLGAFDSNPPSNASSIRLQNLHYYDLKSRERVTHFLSSSFPKLSQLELGNFVPDFSSPILATTSLTSLKLSLPYEENRYTLPQFSQILRQHPGLQKLDLDRGAIPLPGQSSASVPFVLPRLVDLRLYGMERSMLGFIDFIGMSSPLHDVVIRFGHNPNLTAVKKILAAYYECQGLVYPREVHRLSISLNSEERHLVFNARSHSDLKSNLKLQIDGVNTVGNTIAGTFPLFPLNDVREFVAEGLYVDSDGYRSMFQKMKDLSYLRLQELDIWPVLDALSTGDRDQPDQQTVPKLESLTLSYLDILFGCEGQLLDVLGERRDRNIGLKRLVVRSCRVHRVEYISELKELVKRARWDDVTVVASYYEAVDDSTDTDDDDEF